jgi:flagellar biosynthesis GTPase FlhF
MKPIGLLLLMSLGVLASDFVCAETYKCVENGKLTISDTSCPPGAISTVVPPEPRGSASSESVDEEMARLKQELEVMERKRQEQVAEIAHEQAKREKAEQEKEAARKAEAEKVEAQNDAARRNALLRKKKKKLEEEREARERDNYERWHRAP